MNPESPGGKLMNSLASLKDFIYSCSSSGSLPSTLLLLRSITFLKHRQFFLQKLETINFPAPKSVTNDLVQCNFRFMLLAHQRVIAN